MALNDFVPLTTLKNSILGNTSLIPPGQPWTNQFAGVAVQNVPAGTDGDQTVAGWYNQIAAPVYLVFRSDVDSQQVLENVNFTNYTPNDPPDNTNTYNNRAMTIQIKQTNLALLTRLDFFNAGKAGLRNALSDCTQSLLSGNNGNPRDGGWSNILAILRRNARQIEKLYAIKSTGAGTDGQDGTRGSATNPDTLVFEGQITGEDVQLARSA